MTDVTTAVIELLAEAGIKYLAGPGLRIWRLCAPDRWSLCW
jgi:hypothetical protein